MSKATSSKMIRGGLCVDMRSHKDSLPARDFDMAEPPFPTLRVAVGIAASIAIAALADWPVIISLQNLMIAMAFAAGVGCFFGFYPAWKALRMDPIDALRCE